MAKIASAGGAGAAGGFDFQHCVAAWMAVHILAEKGSSLPWDLPAGTTLEWLQCETWEPVDDLLLGTSDNGLVFIQCKRTLQLSPNPNSELASVFDQFVRQFIDCQERKTGKRPTDRPLDILKDRLVLVVGSTTSSSIRNDLPSVLRNLYPQSNPFEDAAVNNNQRKVLDVVRKHIEGSWERELKTLPSEENLRQLLSFVHVQSIDEETSWIETKNILRNVILRNPDFVDMAWAKLINLCSDFARKRSGGDRSTLQRTLIGSGIQINSLRSYFQDIERLKEYSDSMHASIKHLSYIHMGSSAIKIIRPHMEALLRMAKENSVLVVGDPGIGKSGVLYDFVEKLKEDSQDYIFLAVDKLTSGSLGTLREEIGLEHEFRQVLENWNGNRPAYLIIDSLDSARGDSASGMIKDVLRIVGESCKGWHIIASIRKFDLRYDEDIKQFFRGSPSNQFSDPEFQKVSHLNITELSTSELLEIADRPDASILGTRIALAYRSGPSKMFSLLKIPFNLRLLAGVLGESGNSDELSSIGSQFELLELYWKFRVIRTDRNGDVREEILRKACKQMVENQVMRVGRSGLLNFNGGHLDDLLSNQILIEWPAPPIAKPDRYILAFSHNIIFDYALERLILRPNHNDVAKLLENSPDLGIFLRPSLLLHFEYLWTQENTREQFWRLVFLLLENVKVPEIVKLIGPSVAGDLARELSDFEPLLSVYESKNVNLRTLAEKAIEHLIGSLLLATHRKTPLLGEDSGPWCELLIRLSQSHQTLSSAHTLSSLSLLSTICEKPEDLTSAQLSSAGTAARNLFAFVWTQPDRNQWLVIHTIKCVCRTFNSNPTASAELIRRLLEPSRLSEYGFQEIPWLAREVKWVIPIDAHLVEDIYSSVFNHLEVSRERTSMGPSRILPMTSNRQQDYQLGQYLLRESFPQFLKSAPQNAVRALISVMESYVKQYHPLDTTSPQDEAFDFNGRQAHITTDYSSIWNKNSIYGSIHEHQKMFETFMEYLRELAKNETSRDQLNSIIEILIFENRLSIFWCSLLALGTQFPEIIGLKILSLSWTKPILTSYDTTVPVGDFLKVIFQRISNGERERIEQAILGIPAQFPEEQNLWGEKIRDRLLGCLAVEELTTNEARQLLEILMSQNLLPENDQLDGSVAWVSPYGEEEFLRDQGVPVDDQVNQDIRGLEKPIKEFGDKYLNSTPTLEDVNALFPDIERLHASLLPSEGQGVDPQQAGFAWGYLAMACSRIARVDALQCDDSIGSVVKSVLLEASRHQLPVHDPAYDEQFDRSPSWGGASPRIGAAHGLVTFARRFDCGDNVVLEAIKRLSHDPVPAVRFQIATMISGLYRTYREQMWKIIENMSSKEKSRGVLQGLLSGSLSQLRGVEPDRIACLTKNIFDRIKEGPGAKQVQDFSVGILTDLYVSGNNTFSKDVVLGIAKTSSTNPDQAGQVLAQLRGSLKNPANDDVWQRALGILKDILLSAIIGLRQIEGIQEPLFINWSQEDQERLKALIGLIDFVGREIYFSSGAYDDSRSRHQAEATQPRFPIRSGQFYKDMGPLLDELADVGIPSIVHNLLQTLEFFIPLDPQGVFLRFERIIKSGQKGGYQYESMAADLIVRLVERYLAQYRTLFLESQECRVALINILDVFVRVGWPRARNLTYRLEEVFR